MGRQAKLKQQRIDAPAATPRFALEPPAPWSNRDWMVIAALIALVLAVFAQVVRHSFINVDDAALVYANPHVAKGVTGGAIRWAFTSTTNGWQPLTALSHAIDVQLFGLNAGAHLLVNVLLHAITTRLFFAGIRKLTGSTMRSAFAAALFAVHPLQVESVAWLTARPQLLAGLFVAIALVIFAKYSASPRNLLLMLAAISVAIGLTSAGGGESFGNFAYAALRYLAKIIVPVGLATPYTPENVATSTAFASWILVAGITLAVLAMRQRIPYIATGWLWFLIALAASPTSFGDRYTYFASLGIFVAVSFSIPRRALVPATAVVTLLFAIVAFRQTTFWRDSETLFTHTLAVTGDNAIAEYALGDALIARDPKQATAHLQNSIDLGTRAIREQRIAPPEWYAKAHVAIARSFLAQARTQPHGADRANFLEAAAGASKRALSFDAGTPGAAETIKTAEQMLAAEPHAGYEARVNSGLTFAQNGRYPEAIAEFRAAIAARPDLTEPHIYLGLVLLQANQRLVAIEELRKARSMNAPVANDDLTKALRMPPNTENLNWFIDSVNRAK